MEGEKLSLWRIEDDNPGPKNNVNSIGEQSFLFKKNVRPIKRINSMVFKLCSCQYIYNDMDKSDIVKKKGFKQQ